MCVLGYTFTPPFRIIPLPSRKKLINLQVLLRISQFHPLDFIRNEQGRFQTVIQLCPSFSYLFSSSSFRFLPLLRSSLSRDSGVVRSEEQGNDKAEKASRRATSLRLS